MTWDPSSSGQCRSLVADAQRSLQVALLGSRRSTNGQLILQPFLLLQCIVPLHWPSSGGQHEKEVVLDARCQRQCYRNSPNQSLRVHHVPPSHQQEGA